MQHQNSSIKKLSQKGVDEMITKLIVAGTFGLLICVAFSSDGIVDDGLYSAVNSDALMAANPRKDRRDDRQGDRNENRDGKQECRHEEGLAGDDKRECKQEKRGEGDGDEGAEVEKEGDA